MHENDYGSLIERWKVALIGRRARRMGFRRDELPDLQQQIVLVLCEFRFDPQRTNGATEKTAVTALIDRQLRAIRRAQLRRDRRFESLDDADDESFADVGPQEPSLGLDIPAALDGLSPWDRHICRALAEGHTIDRIARRTGRSWHTINSSVARIQRHFQQLGLGDSLRN